MSETAQLREVVVIVNALGRGGVERGASNAALGFQAHGFRTRIGVTDPASVGRNSPGGCAEHVDTLVSDEQLQPEIVHVHAHRLDWSAVDRARERWPDATFVEQSIWSRPMPSTRSADIIVHQSPWMMACFQSRTALRRQRGRSIVLGAPVLPSTTFAADGRPSAQPLDSDGVSARARFRERHGIPSGAVLIGRVGQAVGDKWDAVLVDSFRTVAGRSPMACLLVVAAPAGVLEQVEALPQALRDRVIIIDWVDSDAGMAKIYASIDIFAHAARRGESFGFVLIEAISAGVPVLTLSTPEADNAQVDWILESGAGLVAPDRRSFVLLLAELTENVQTRAQLASVAIGFDERFAPEAFVGHLLAIIEEGAGVRSWSSFEGPRAQLATLRAVGDSSLLTRVFVAIRPLVAWSYKSDRLWTELARRIMR